MSVYAKQKDTKIENITCGYQRGKGSRKDQICWRADRYKLLNINQINKSIL